LLAGVIECPISLVFPEEVSMPPDQIKKWEQLISSAENLFYKETTGVIGLVLYQSCITTGHATQLFYPTPRPYATLFAIKFHNI
jgi:hypothetical protein